LALGAYLAVRVARALRILLDEGVLLRLNLNEGTAQVTSITPTTLCSYSALAARWQRRASSSIA